MNKEKSLSLYDIIRVIEEYYIYIIFFALFISTLPSYLIYINYSNDNARIKLIFESPPSIRFDLENINNSINQLYFNPLFNQLQDRLEFFYSGYVLFEKKESFSLNTGKKSENYVDIVDDFFYRKSVYLEKRLSKSRKTKKLK